MRVRGFTLIELSIVLVVVGLIVGGVLVGQDLVRASAVRATITQLDQYNTAVNAFLDKYVALPGDMNTTIAGKFGFTPRGACSGATPCYGEGDGNGVIEGITMAGASSNNGFAQGAGETGLFWIDLTSANGLNLNMIDGNFKTAPANAAPPDAPANSGTTPTLVDVVWKYLPPAKLGQGNYIHVYSNNGANYFGISIPLGLTVNANYTSRPGLSVAQAYSIDKKMDDGLPTSGTMTAQFANNLSLASSAHTGVNAASCYDSVSLTYNMTVSNGANIVCGISQSFK